MHVAQTIHSLCLAGTTTVAQCPQLYMIAAMMALFVTELNPLQIHSLSQSFMYLLRKVITKRFITGCDNHFDILHGT